MKGTNIRVNITQASKGMLNIFHEYHIIIGYFSHIGIFHDLLKKYKLAYTSHFFMKLSYLISL